MISRALAASCFSEAFGCDSCSIFFLCNWLPLCARTRRTRSSHRKKQWISSIYQFLPSRRRAPRQAANPSNHVRKHVRTSFKNRRLLILFRLPGGLPEKYPPGKPPGGSPGPSGTLPGPQAEIDQLFAPRCPQEPPNEFFGASGGPRGRPRRRPGRLPRQGSG